ncbi:MAG TPA: hypothetical protein VN636_01055 [Acidimicrobiia bacterium]|nr:hypothetical protein [Acidimicrobiia bacterium]
MSHSHATLVFTSVTSSARTRGFWPSGALLALVAAALAALFLALHLTGRGAWVPRPTGSVSRRGPPRPATLI